MLPQRQAPVKDLCAISINSSCRTSIGYSSAALASTRFYRLSRGLIDRGGDPQEVGFGDKKYFQLTDNNPIPTFKTDPVAQRPNARSRIMRGK